jgi:hypothetical protein
MTSITEMPEPFKSFAERLAEEIEDSDIAFDSDRIADLWDMIESICLRRFNR